MIRRMMDLLCCPVCRDPLELEVHEELTVEMAAGTFPGCRCRCAYRSLPLNSTEAEREAHSRCPACYRRDVREGMLSCPSAHRFPIRRSIPRFNLQDVHRGRTKRTFDVEWTVFRYDEKIYGHSQQEELQDFFLRSQVDEAFLAGKTVLDAGCGTGRLTQSVGRLAREVVGFDFSEGVEEAWFRNREQVNVHLVQADLMNPPFRGASFDYVYSKGVLHYVPDVRACLGGLAMQVRQGGALSVTIYPRMSHRFERFNDGLRSVSARVPVSVLFGLSHLLIPFLSIAWRWSGLARRRIQWRESAHMIFNWLSSEHLNRASNETMEQWFRELGLRRIRLSSLPVGITGEKLVP